MTAMIGGCHCGNIRLTFETEKSPEDLGSRFCTCSYCARQNARYGSDPEGSVTLEIEDETKVIRYRFGTSNADFTSCGRCGVYLGAVADLGHERRMVINVMALDKGSLFPTPLDHSYDGEDPESS